MCFRTVHAVPHSQFSARPAIQIESGRSSDCVLDQFSPARAPNGPPSRACKRRWKLFSRFSFPFHNRGDNSCQPLCRKKEPFSNQRTVPVQCRLGRGPRFCTPISLTFPNLGRCRQSRLRSAICARFAQICFPRPDEESWSWEVQHLLPSSCPSSSRNDVKKRR